MKILSFPAVRPTTNIYAQSIASLPYDVMNVQEARAMAADNPDCFLHVVRSELGLPDGVDVHSDIVYRKAREALNAMMTDGRLAKDSSRGLYIYRQAMGRHQQTAVVACCPIDDYANGTILKHEKTRQDKEDDRTRHILETRANTGQVFLTYRDVAAIDALVTLETAKLPVYDFVAADEVRHTVWTVTGVENFVKAFETVPRAYIADGHHRSAASYRAGMELRNQEIAKSRNREIEKSRSCGIVELRNQEAEYNGFMACLFPASQLKILPYNRLVSSLNGLTAEQFLEEVKRRFSVEETQDSIPQARQSCMMYLDRQWYRLSWEGISWGAGVTAVDTLDVSVLQNRLLAPVLGIQDPRTDSRVAFIGGVRGTGELAKAVHTGVAAVAFSMYPTTVAEMMAIADAGAIMPPKSTWFEPKLRSGLLIHSLD